MAFSKVNEAKDLAVGRLAGAKIGDKELLVVNLGGTMYSIGNKCTHAGCKLSSGTIEGETVKCKCHGSVFNLKTGEVVHGPARNPEPRYNMKIENGDVWVDI